jgi:hypothetical protein
MLLVVGVAFAWANARRSRLDRLRREAADVIARVSRRPLRITPVRLILQPGEHALVEEDVALYETRPYTILYGGGDSPSPDFAIGGGWAETDEEVKRIDWGTLTLTTKRLVFDGRHEARSVDLADLLTATPTHRSLDISARQSSRKSTFSVRNPFLWAALIERAASGKLSVGDRFS